MDVLLTSEVTSCLWHICFFLEHTSYGHNQNWMKLVITIIMIINTALLWMLTVQETPCYPPWAGLKCIHGVTKQQLQFLPRMDNGSSLRNTRPHSETAFTGARSSRMFEAHGKRQHFIFLAGWSFQWKLKINDASIKKSIRRKGQNSPTFVNSVKLCADQIAADRES